MKNQREILFRGKRTDGAGWAYGCYTCWEYNTHTLQVDFVPRICTKGCAGYGIVPETLGQYTGLNDRKGQKIFEGDLIKGKGKEVFQVVYQPSISSFMAVEHGDFECRWIPSLNYGTMKSYEVIGNVHDEQKQMEITL